MSPNVPTVPELPTCPQLSSRVGAPKPFSTDSLFLLPYHLLPPQTLYLSLNFLSILPESPQMPEQGLLLWIIPNGQQSQSPYQYQASLPLFLFFHNFNWTTLVQLPVVPLLVKEPMGNWFCASVSCELR